MSSRREVRNEFAANTGFGNNWAFIKLGSDPDRRRRRQRNLPPTLGTVQQSSASGTTAPERVTVRVYNKASAEPGGLGVQLAVVKPDAVGNWKATFAKQAVGTLVAATATERRGRLRSHAPVATTADPEEKKAAAVMAVAMVAQPAPAPQALRLPPSPRSSRR